MFSFWLIVYILEYENFNAPWLVMIICSVRGMLIYNYMTLHHLKMIIIIAQ